MPETPPPRRLRILGILAFLSWLQLYGGALFAIGVVVGFGGPVAMWWKMLEGDTEPTAPTLPYPWTLSLLAALLPLPWAWRRAWRWASLATIPLVAIPTWYLVKLLTLPPSG